MSPRCALLCRGLLGCVVLLPLLRPTPVRGATPEQVDQAIERGKKFLYSQQKAGGHWEPEHHGHHWQAGHWEREGHRHVWREGGWDDDDDDLDHDHGHHGHGHGYGHRDRD